MYTFKYQFKTKKPSIEYAFCSAPLSLGQGTIAMMDGFHGIHPSAPLQSHRRSFSNEIHIQTETHSSEAAQGKKNPV